MKVSIAVALALFVGAAPLVACSSGGQQADDTAETAAVDEEATTEEEAAPEADEAMWVKVSETLGGKQPSAAVRATEGVVSAF